MKNENKFLELWSIHFYDLVDELTCHCHVKKMMMIIEMIRSWWRWWWSRWSWDLELTCPCHVKVRSRPLPTSFPHKSNDSLKIVMIKIICTIITPPTILFWKVQKITKIWWYIIMTSRKSCQKKLFIIKVPDLDCI